MACLLLFVLPCGAAGPDAIVLDMLRNIHANGINQAAGGLWINWRYGSKPLQTNELIEMFRVSGDESIARPPTDLPPPTPPSASRATPPT